MRARILGPLEVWVHDTWVPVRAAKQRELLALLVLHGGRLLDRDWLIEVLWHGRAPASATQLLTHYVWRLRSLLPAGADQLRTAPTGYLFVPDAVDLDHESFAALHREGRDAADRGDHDLAVDRLAAALRLWRGPALADVRSGPLLVAAAQRLDLTRVEAQEALAASQLAGGRPAEAVAVLEELTGAEPFRERPWSLLMSALNGVGRRPDALAAYQRLWRIWTDQLGIEPSQDLRDLHRRLLVDAPPPGADHATEPRAVAAPPRQLPAPVRQFVGRAAELHELTGLVDDLVAGRGTVVISAIDGSGGIGKTALAVFWAHQIAPRFPDGQLYVNLRGFDPAGRPVTAGEAVRGFLDALGVPAQRIPPTVDAQTGLYRSLLAGRRVLVVLDNARDAEQVRPLLPGSATCQVVVTSRSRLTGLLATEDAHLLTLDLLTEEEAHELLARRAGRTRVAADGPAAGEIVARCVRLPLALAIVGARVSAHPELTLGQVAGQLRQARGGLDLLGGDDAATDLRAVFSWSYDTLSPDAARLFRLLGLHPGPDLAVPAAASLAGLPPDEVVPLLAELARGHLIEEHTPGRFASHDLLRAYAADLVSTVDADGARRAAVHRMVDHYLHTARAADRRLNPYRDPIPVTPADAGVVVEAVGDVPQALDWFTVERRVLIAVIDRAVQAGLDVHANRLAAAVATFLHRRGHWHDQVSTQQTALAAAQRLGDRFEMARAHNSLALAYNQLGQFAAAAAEFRRALRVARAAGDEVGLGHARIGLSAVAERQGRHADSLREAKNALVHFRNTGNHAGQGRILNSIAWGHAQLGEFDEAMEFGSRALDILREAGDRHGEANAWDTLGFAHHHRGDHRRAVECYRHAHDLSRDTGDRYGQGEAYLHIGNTYEVAGEPEAAHDAWRTALAIFEELHHADAEVVRAKLATGATDPARSTVLRR